MLKKTRKLTIKKKNVSKKTRAKKKNIKKRGGKNPTYVIKSDIDTKKETEINKMIDKIDKILNIFILFNHRKKINIDEVTFKDNINIWDLSIINILLDIIKPSILERIIKPKNKNLVELLQQFKNNYTKSNDNDIQSNKIENEELIDKSNDNDIQSNKIENKELIDKIILNIYKNFLENVKMNDHKGKEFIPEDALYSNIINRTNLLFIYELLNFITSNNIKNNIKNNITNHTLLLNYIMVYMQYMQGYNVSYIEETLDIKETLDIEEKPDIEEESKIKNNNSLKFPNAYKHVNGFIQIESNVKKMNNEKYLQMLIQNKNY